MSHPSAFKTPEGEAAFFAAYDAAMKAWPVPYDEFEIPSRFGTTYVIASGPPTAPPLVLLHGYMATSVMWAPNVADFSRHYRVYAIDVMGQPGRSIAGDPIGSVADYVSWLNTTLYELRLNRFSLIGMSYGGWLALNYAIAQPQRVEKLVLLSPGGLLPLVRQFTARGMLMTLLPSRITVNSFMHWLGFGEESAAVFELMRLGLRHSRVAPETLRLTPTVFSHGELSTLDVPTLVLMGDEEVIYDPAKALERVQALLPDVEGALVPGSKHDMCVTQHAYVDARVIDFLQTRTPAARGGAGRRAA
jgi:pimeloyl-ACP methyl ester carboxylesterase